MSDIKTAILEILDSRGFVQMTSEERLSAWLEAYQDNDTIPADLFHDIKVARDALIAIRRKANSGFDNEKAGAPVDGVRITPEMVETEAKRLHNEIYERKPFLEWGRTDAAHKMNMRFKAVQGLKDKMMLNPQSFESGWTVVKPGKIGMPGTSYAIECDEDCTIFHVTWRGGPLDSKGHLGEAKAFAARHHDNLLAMGMKP